LFGKSRIALALSRVETALSLAKFQVFQVAPARVFASERDGVSQFPETTPRYSDDGAGMVLLWLGIDPQTKQDRGVLAGYPMDDVRVTVYDGSYHDVDSSEAAFKVAGHLAFVEAAHRAKPILLEPIMQVSVVAPPEYHSMLSMANTAAHRS
jgi:hypothetical protein